MMLRILPDTPITLVIFSIVSHLFQQCSAFYPIYFSDVQYSVLIYLSDD